MEESIQTFFDQLKNQYTTKNKIPGEVFKTLEQSLQCEIENDHIALRTFNRSEVNIKKISQAFLDRGYSVNGKYEFVEKKLKAIHLEHCTGKAPKVFISELEVEKLSVKAQKIINGLVDQISKIEEPLCMAGRLWQICWDDYQALAKESEYASWLAAHGFMANHFTININGLPKLGDIKELNRFLKSKGFSLNESGGEVKGSPKDKLEQSSTVAEMVEVDFAGEAHKVPGCFIEFAKRYPDASGELFQGFITQSADRIFESTDMQSANQ